MYGMISTFQGWRFQRWKQASLWTAKKIRRISYSKKIRFKRKRRIIEGNSTSRFCMIESHGNDSKTRKLGALWTETERRWKAIFHLRTADSKIIEKRFLCIELWLEMRSGYSTTTPRRKNTTLSPVNPVAIDFNINTAEHSWFEDHALYLMGPKGSCLLWAAKNWRFHYGRSVSATIDSFEPCIARKTAEIRAKTW